jgi:hypothetical protein
MERKISQVSPLRSVAAKPSPDTAFDVAAGGQRTLNAELEIVTAGTAIVKKSGGGKRARKINPGPAQESSGEA